MNERIKELYLQAVEYSNGQMTFGDTREYFAEKFAELIVNDCTDIINKRKDAAIEASWNVDEAMSNAVWDIESHFYGVDE